MDLEPGDEVICPSINFRGAPMAIIGQGGTWVPCEVESRTLQADPEDVERRMTSRTRAILPVHMNGGPAYMDEYAAIAERHPHPRHGPPRIVYDAARACGATYKGRRVGRDGWLTVFSFHTQKLISTLGEGGAVTTDDPDLNRRLRDIRQFGGDAGWGTNYKLTKVQAAVGLVQLPKLDSFIQGRQRLARRRDELLRSRAELTLPAAVPGGGHTYYLYTLLVPRDWAGPRRDLLLELLKRRFGVQSVVANPPCHSSHPFLRRHTPGVRLPVSEELGRRLFCLPIHPAMSDEDNEYICAALCQALDEAPLEPGF
jgi:dTDP-4-amino-4,6-dideoxygalactose transaminase